MTLLARIARSSCRPAERSLVASLAAALFITLFLPAQAAASDSKFSDQQRQQIIRTFLAERPFVHHALPRGKTGITIEGDRLNPSEAELNHLIAQFGATAKPGDRAKITAIHFQHNGILFDINGGLVKRKKLRDRISIGLGGMTTTRDDQQQQTPGPGADSNVYNDSQGSAVLLVVKQDAASMTTDRIKDLLAPILDFKAMSVAEAYQKALPPILAAAVKDHRALVGMDKEMVTYAMGRPPRRLRENKEGQDIEEWIYGAPPQEVDFIRFVGDKVVSIEQMKVTGEKVLRTKNEIGDVNTIAGTSTPNSLDASSRQQPRPDATAAPAEEERRTAPTLMRPDEKRVNDDPAPPDPYPNPADTQGNQPPQ